MSPHPVSLAVVPTYYALKLVRFPWLTLHIALTKRKQKGRGGWVRLKLLERGKRLVDRKTGRKYPHVLPLKVCWSQYGASGSEERKVTWYWSQIRLIHSIGMCRKRRILAVIRSFFHSLLYSLSFHPSPPTILPSSLTSSCHLFLGLPLSLVSKFIYNAFFWEFCFLPFSVRVQTNVIYLTLLYLL